MKSILVVILCFPVFIFTQKLTSTAGSCPAAVQDFFNINGFETVSQDLELKIANNMGQIFSSENLKQFKVDYLKEIMLDKYSKGIYYFYIKTNEDVINKKVIYQ